MSNFGGYEGLKFEIFQGLRPLTPWGAYSAPRPPAVLRRHFVPANGPFGHAARGRHNNNRAPNSMMAPAAKLLPLRYCV